ncbi:MAG: DUF481 domain-containing protein [Bacteroidota bacterium]
MNRIRTILAIFLLAVSHAAWGGLNIDTIYFQNGDRVTGEVLELTNNQMRFNTDDAGTIKIEWNTVDSVMVLNTMRIVLDDGHIMYGQIHFGDDDGTGTIRPIGGIPMWVYLVRIVSLTPVAERFIDRLGGQFSSGFSYAKASEVMQFNLSGSLDYDAEKNHMGLFYDGNVTNDPVSGRDQRQKGGTNYKRYLPKKWFLVAQFTAEENSELDLDLRTSIEFGGGNSLIYSNRMRLDAGAGLLANREWSMDLTANNLETVFVGEYSIYIYDAPEVSFNFHINVLPSLSDPGRVRNEIDSSLKWEVFTDFFLKWSFYYSYDSRPLSVDAEKNDWAITMLGIEYELK